MFHMQKSCHTSNFHIGPSFQYNVQHETVAETTYINLTMIGVYGCWQSNKK